MNEKIKQLYNQAINEASEEMREWHTQWNNKPPLFDYEKCLYGKFGDLLIKEAEAKYFSEGYLAGKTDGINEGIQDCINHFEEHGDMVSAGNLQSHFGIE
jgi:hypothetical protein